MATVGMTVRYDIVHATVAGDVALAVTDDGLWRVSLAIGSEESFREEVLSLNASIDLRRDPHATAVVRNQVEQYLAGKLKIFDVRLDLRSITPFRRKVMETAAAIPYGRVATYGEVARSAGNPKAARAVGSFMASNPVPLVVPCHRVVGSDGSLVGFAPGVEYKVALLAMESVGMERGKVLLRETGGGSR